MKRIILALIVRSSMLVTVTAQKALTLEKNKIRDGVLYLTYDGDELDYFSKPNNQDGKQTTGESTSFSLVKDNTCNIYMKWVNPLKCRLTWKDSVYTDERDQIINAFVTQLANQFGAPVTSLMAEKNAGDKIKIGGTRDPKPERFNSPELNMLYVMINMYQKYSDSDILTNELKNITPQVRYLDRLISIDFAGQIKLAYNRLVETNRPDSVIPVSEEVEEQIKGWNSSLDSVKQKQKWLETKMAEFSLDDALFGSYIQSTLLAFVEQTKKPLLVNSSLVVKLKPVVKLFRNSVFDESSNTSGYYKTREVHFEDGKVLATSLSIAEYKYDQDKNDFVKSGKETHKSFIFRKYDCFEFFVSTGLFYSSTTLKGFGVSGDGSSQFTVTEKAISKNTPVTAAFLNAAIGIGSRYLAPILQCGIDPTKKRPFLLLGGGFTIPVARIAITGGPVWTWDASLKTLQVGGAVTSTTDLEDDIQYDFDVVPKGWYLGIQYNF